MVDFFDGFQILGWGRVSNLNIIIVTKLIPHFEQLIGDDVVHLGINVSHIASERAHDVDSSLLVKVFLHIFVEALHKLVEFVSSLIFLEDHWNILKVVLVDIESLRPAVGSETSVLLLIQGDSEDVFPHAQVLFMWSPNLCSSLVLPHLCLFIAINF